MVNFLQGKLEQDREFRSEELQEQNNERKAWEWQHNKLIIQNQQIQAQGSQAIQALQQSAGSDLGFVIDVAVKTVK